VSAAPDSSGHDTATRGDATVASVGEQSPLPRDGAAGDSRHLPDRGFARIDDPLEELADRQVRRWSSPGQSSNFVVRTAWKAVILVVGVTVIAGGLAMLVLPGPGIVVIIAGLAILATEFVWARHLLMRAKAHAEKAKGSAIGAIKGRRWGRKKEAEAGAHEG